MRSFSKKIFTLSNILSFLRVPLAFLFFSQNQTLRLAAVILAMFTDSIDGYIARRFNQTSLAGAIMDPIMDKFFVYFVLIVFLREHQILLWQVLTLLSRDFALCIYAIYLTLSKKWSEVAWRSIRFGKLTTALQFCLMIALIFSVIIPNYIYWIFVVIGIFSLIELFVSQGKKA